MTSGSRDYSLRGLYVILDPSVCPNRPLVATLMEAAAAGVTMFQYRSKSASMNEAYREVLPLRKAAMEAGALLIVNDRCDLALAVDADGVHLGQDDLPFDDARRLMGPNKLIGLSTHTARQVKEADRLKPDYIGFGPIFTPGSKRDHEPVVGLDALRHVRSLTGLPIFAIGGIHADQVWAVMQAGANGIAVISAILRAPDVNSAVTEFLTRLTRPASPAS